MSQSSEAQNNADASTSQPAKTAVAPSFLGMAKRRRKPWFIIAACAVALVGILVTSFKETKRMGIIEYSSDDPKAQVVLEKDGQDIPLEQGTKFSMKLEPGHYNIRLVGKTEGLKVQPFVNLDPGGRGIITVRREIKLQPR